MLEGSAPKYNTMRSKTEVTLLYTMQRIVANDVLEEWFSNIIITDY